MGQSGAGIEPGPPVLRTAIALHYLGQPGSLFKNNKSQENEIWILIFFAVLLERYLTV